MLFGLIPWTYVCLIAYASYLISIWIRRWLYYRDLRRLGPRSAVIKTWAPYGFDHPFKAAIEVSNNRGPAFWDWMYSSTGTDNNKSYTCEVNVIITTRVIFTSDPENIKAILTTQFQDYGKGAQFHDEWKEFLGNSIFTTDGQLWHDSRQLIRPMFIRERVADLDIFETHVTKLKALIGPGDGKIVDLDRLFFRFSLDAATHYLFGKSVDSLDDEQSRFAAAFNEVQRIQALDSRAGALRHLIPHKTFYAGLKTMEEFIEPFITTALSLTPSELDTKLKRDDTFIHALARHTRDRKVMRDQLTALLLAGRDTTASTMSWVFLELARHPAVVARLRKEILEVLGPSGRPPTYQQIKDMRYVTHMINETLRLYPVVPFNVRASLVDTTLPRGGGPDGMSPIGVKKDTPVGYSTYHLHRRRDLYPPISTEFPYDPLEWAPERWETWTPKSWQFIPFNGGPRICIGQQFAIMEMGYTIVRLFQEYESLVDGGSQPIMHTDIVLTPAEGVKVGFVRKGLSM